MPTQDFEAFHGSNIPQTNGLVVTSACNDRRVWAKRESFQATVVLPTQFAYELFGLHVPKSDSRIFACTCEKLAVMTKGNGPYWFRVSY
jgi:hypothetical protein